MKYKIITFGCQMNKSDSERIAALLEEKGYKSTLKENEADLIVVNMCSVRQSAVNRIFGLDQKFSKLKIKNEKLKIILTGCVLKEDKKKFAKRFNSILNIKDLTSWPNSLCYNFYGRRRRSIEKKCENYLDIKPKRRNKTVAFVPISNGCNNFCSYCVVPFARGPLICRDHKKILKEIKNAVKEEKKPIRNKISNPVRNRKFLNGANEAREIWLLGQNVNDYQSPTDSRINFARLIKMVNEIPGNFKFFFISPHPKNFSDELINALVQSKKFGKLLNLPVQSGDNKILKKMNRNYTLKEYKNLVKKMREKILPLKLSTDVIVGFPGETEKQFQNTVKLFKEIKFDWAYISKYSPRPGTAAFKLKDNVSLEEKKKREQCLRKLLSS